MSKLDRFLLSEEVLDDNRNLKAIILDRLWSDHSPILLHIQKINYGPTSIKIFHSWFQRKDVDVMVKQGFVDGSQTNEGWIQECLRYAHTSVLLNGSPTSEFSIKRGLRQGDPLSPFLFVLIMEGFHVAIKDAAHANLIKGVSVGNPCIFLSHFFYADDVVLVTEWSHVVMDNIIRLFNVFFASGLRINIYKSNVYGIGVSDDEIEDMAQSIGCLFEARLSKWKAYLLSLGGRSTFSKAMLGSVDKDSKKLILIKWEKALASFGKEGLGFGSLKSFNLALLQKWRWRLISNPNLLWVQVIKAIHREEVGLSHFACKSKGLWAKIIGYINHLHSNGIIPTNTLRFKVGCGSHVRFWIYNWIGDSPLLHRYNRLYRLELHLNCVISDRFVNGEWHWQWRRIIDSERRFDMLKALLTELESVPISSGNDEVRWGLNPDGSFYVSVTRDHIDDVILSTLPAVTSWCKILPKKVNIFIWRLRLDKLPHRFNLSRHGLDIQAIACSVCSKGLLSFSRKYGLRRFLFLDKMSDVSDEVRHGYSDQLHSVKYPTSKKSPNPDMDY
nr:RNA-directed DNA polymerase, eukaryota, reverse transcriptase zinc-binding domain protein [Tanacetum cinerariifolium]